MLDHPEYTATLCGKIFGPRGKEVGNTLDGCGYKRFNATDKTLKKRITVLAHRFVYEHFNGPIPDGLQIDHINRDKADNRISNLRAVTQLENMRNRYDHPYEIGPEARIRSLGDDGCIYTNSGGRSFYVLTSISLKRVYLGVFETKELAREARDKAIRMNHATTTTKPVQVRAGCHPYKEPIL